MSKQVAVELIPIGAGDKRLREPSANSCAANLYQGATDWEKSALDIRWDAKERTFFVEFNGKADKADIGLGDILSKKIPIQIADSSRCECGSILSLGNYRVIMNDSDFNFKAEYFCPTCQVELVAEKKGIMPFLQKWFSSLKKIEIKATGVGLERAVENPSSFDSMQFGAGSVTLKAKSSSGRAKRRTISAKAKPEDALNEGATVKPSRGLP